MRNDEVPKNAEHLAAMLEGQADQNEVGDGPKILVSLRLPLFDVAWIDALAARLGKSRNYTMHMLVEVAQQEVTARLSAEAGQALYEDFNNRALEMVQARKQPEGA